MNGLDVITAERRSQEEAWGSAHDDIHVKGELTAAAMCYLKLAETQIGATLAWHTLPEKGNPMLDKMIKQMMNEVPKGWPWEPMDWHPSALPKNNLRKAGALTAAEWDRIDRMGF